MSDWEFVFTDEAIKDLKKLDKPVVRQVRMYLDDVVSSGDPRSRGNVMKYERSGQWKYRVRDYRVFAWVIDDTKTIEVIAVNHRKDAYR